jgi:hypothetical protein
MNNVFNLTHSMPLRRTFLFHPLLPTRTVALG